MAHRIEFENSGEIGAYTRLTNKYCLIASSENRNYYSIFQENLEIPIVETTLNNIKTIGSYCQGNKNGLILPITTTDPEFQHIVNSIPDGIVVKRIDERLNAFGNVILCNDKIAIVHPELSNEVIENISDILGVDVIKKEIGCELLVGTFACMNNVGMMVHYNTRQHEIEDFCDNLGIRVVSGSVNRGSSVIGGGLVVNDWVGFVGHRTTPSEIGIVDDVFQLRELSEKDDALAEKN